MLTRQSQRTRLPLERKRQRNKYVGVFIKRRFFKGFLGLLVAVGVFPFSLPIVLFVRGELDSDSGLKSFSQNRSLVEMDNLEVPFLWICRFNLLVILQHDFKMPTIVTSSITLLDLVMDFPCF